MSITVSQRDYLISTDMGLMQVRMKTVRGYDMEDIIRDKAVSQARAIQLVSLGKRVDQSKPTAPRTMATAFLNNEEELPL